VFCGGGGTKLTAKPLMPGAGDDINKESIRLGGWAANEELTSGGPTAGMNGMVLLDGDFLEKHVAGLTNGINPFGEKEVGASSVVMPVCFPNTNIPSFCKGEDVVVTATPLVGCGLFDNLVAKVRFQSPTVILAPMNCFLLLQVAQVAESSIPRGDPPKLKCRL